MKKSTRWVIRIAVVVYLILASLCIHDEFTFLILNTFLAYIPIELSFHIHCDRPRSNIVFWILTIIWVLFLPNAPYMLTDLMHLTLLDPYNWNTGLIKANLGLWANFSELVVAALAATIISIWGVDYVADVIVKRYHLKNNYQFIIVNIILFLSALGIYIGRFLRLHTIFLITPFWVIKPLLTMWSWHMLAIVLMLYFVQFIIYIALLIFRNNAPKNKKDCD